MVGVRTYGMVVMLCDAVMLMFDVVPRAVSRHIFVVHHTALLDVDGQANVCPSSREEHLPNFGAPLRDGGEMATSPTPTS